VNKVQRTSAVLACSWSIAMLCPERSLAEGPQPIDTGVERKQAAQQAVVLQKATTHQSDEDAEAEDLALVAKAHGWSLEQARLRAATTEAVGRAAEEVSRVRPDIFVGSVLSSDPAGAATLFVKGAPSAVADLVAKHDPKIIISGDQPFSFVELEERQHVAHRLIESLGYGNIVTQTDILQAGKISVAVGRTPGLSESVDDIVRLLPDHLRAQTTLSFVEASNFDDKASRGGMLATDDGVFECTTGWPVFEILGGVWRVPVGLTTAGHCGGINGVLEAGVGIHGMTFQAEHRGAYGDVEWHRTVETPDAVFVSSNGATRNLHNVEPISGMTIGESVCVYSPQQGIRDCGSTIDTLSVSCTVGGVSNNRLVRLDSEPTIGGDSGSGWSFNNTAYGSLKGICTSGHDLFSAAAYYPNAIGRGVYAVP
jgi:streptogrisin C